PIALPIDRSFVATRLPEVEALAPGLAGQPLSRVWAAAVDHTPDALPVVDEAAPGCVVVAGGGHGMMWGPALGEAAAEFLVDGTRAGLPPAEVGLGRFHSDCPVIRETISLKPPLA
ncbi:MAG TPA: FAD-dependent oxidoreductase, partial [Thermomicrobiales bacterium]|nr:FAD-dependent oxidoreductase [Thermomicrobiales bacterium]